MSKICTTAINIRQKKAYVTTQAKTSIGLYMDVEPVLTLNLNTDELAHALEQMFKAGNPEIQHPSKEDLKKLSDPILKAAKVGSWKKLAQGGAQYSVTWYTEKITISMSNYDDKGRFDWDWDKTRELPPNASMSDIAKIILDDVQSRPDVQTE